MSSTQTVTDNSNNNGTPAHALADVYRTPEKTTAQLFIPGGSSQPIELPLLHSGYSDALPAIDLAPLVGRMIAIDSTNKVHGLASNICKVFPQGRLFWHGRDFSEPMEWSALRAAYFVLTGDDDIKAAADFASDVESRMHLPPEATDLLNAMPTAAQPMDQLIALCTTLLPSIHGMTVNMKDPEQRMEAAKTAIAMMPMFAGAIVSKMQNRPFVEAKTGEFMKRYCTAMFGERFTTEQLQFLRAHYISHMEHDLNLSTMAARTNASGGGSMFAAVCAGINALAVPNHGGAAQDRVDQLSRIAKGSVSAEQLVEDCLAKRGLLMGFFHGVYQAQDPRYGFLRPMVDSLYSGNARSNDSIVKAMLDLDNAIKGTKFENRQNVDAAGGPGLYLCGLPQGSFTIPFAVSRTVGWCTHVIEEVQNGIKIRRMRCFCQKPAE